MMAVIRGCANRPFSVALRLRAITVAIIAGVILLAGWSSANAAYIGAPITFDFSTLSNSSTISQIDGIFNAALQAAGVTYNNKQVTVEVGGAIASTTYNADGHVVGPVKNGNVSSSTLDTLSGQFSSLAGPFLQNNSPASNLITINFGVISHGNFV